MDPRKQGFCPRINCSQMKSPNFGSPFSDSSSKIGRHFSNKVVLKMKSAKNAFYKKRYLNSSMNLFLKDSDDF